MNNNNNINESVIHFFEASEALFFTFHRRSFPQSWYISVFFSLAVEFSEFSNELEKLYNYAISMLHSLSLILSPFRCD